MFFLIILLLILMIFMFLCLMFMFLNFNLDFWTNMMSFLLNHLNIRCHVGYNGWLLLIDMGNNNLLRINFACLFFRWWNITWLISIVHCADIRLTLDWIVMNIVDSLMSIMLVTFNIYSIVLLCLNSDHFAVLLSYSLCCLLLHFVDIHFLSSYLNITTF